MLAIDPCLLPRGSRCSLDETGAAPLLERNVDDIEIPRDDGLGEELPRLAGDLGAEVAVREVREREQAHPCRLRQRGRAGARRVERLVGARSFLFGERRLVHEEVSLLGHLEGFRRRSGIARDDDLPARPRRAEHLLRPHLAASGEPHGLPGLEEPEERALGHAQRACGLDVEAPGPRELGERVAVGREPVRDPEDENSVVAAIQGVPVAKLAELDRVRQLPEDPLQAAEQIPFKVRVP